MANRLGQQVRLVRQGWQGSNAFSCGVENVHVQAHARGEELINSTPGAKAECFIDFVWVRGLSPAARKIRIGMKRQAAVPEGHGSYMHSVPVRRWWVVRLPPTPHPTHKEKLHPGSPQHPNTCSAAEGVGFGTLWSSTLHTQAAPSTPTPTQYATPFS